MELIELFTSEECEQEYIYDPPIHKFALNLYCDECRQRHVFFSEGISSAESIS